MKWIKITPTTRNGRVSRIIFMVVTVLFAIYICWLCIRDAQLAGMWLDESWLEDHQYTEFSADFALSVIETVWFAVSAVVILVLCLRCSVVTSCVAWGVSVAGSLLSLVVNEQLSEYVFYKYYMLAFLSVETNLRILPYVKPTIVTLVIAAATYFLIAQLTEHKKATKELPPQELTEIE